MSAHEPNPDAIQDRRSFGRELTALRLRKPLTVREVADRAQAFGSHSTVGDWFAGRGLPSPSSLDLFVRVLAACGVEGDAQSGPWLAGWRRARASGRRATGPEPYRGLSAYQSEDAAWYFGREALIETLLGRLAAMAGTGGVELVVGVSGAGKSSLLRAGVSPRVESGGLGGEPDWEIVLGTPGADPMSLLAAARAAPPGRRLLVVVDQFEELFADSLGEDVRQRFVDRLLALAEGPRRAVVVIGLRADFYAQALRFPALLAAAGGHQLTVGPMTPAELREVITAPARRAGAHVDEGLVEVLLRDLSPGSNSLPLLSHALLATWQRSGGRMSVEVYRQIGGISGAVTETAESIYESLTAAQRVLARRLFLRLVHVSPGTADTRQRITWAELTELGRGTGVEIMTVLDRYVAQRLITTGADTIELSHEALVTAWSRLRGWLDSDRAGLLVARQLHLAAAAWKDDGHDRALLYGGTRLAAAQAWAASADGDLTAQAAEFLQASVRHSRRRARRVTQLVAVLTALVVLTVTLAGAALQLRAEADGQRRVALRERNEAVSRLIAGRADKLRDTDVSLAMQLSLAAYRIAPTLEARSSLLDSSNLVPSTRLAPLDGAVQAVAFSADGGLLAAAGTGNTVRLWPLGRPAPVLDGTPLPGVDQDIFGLAFNAGGRLLAAAGASGRILLWDVRDPRRPVALPPLTGPAGTVYALAFDRHGVLAAAGIDGRIRRWDTTVTGPPAALPEIAAGSATHSLAFAPDGSLLAAGGANGAVRLWDTRDPRRPAALPTAVEGVDGKMFAVAFSPDGTTLAAGNADKTVRLADVSDPRRPRVRGAPLTGPASWINAVTFSRDGRTVIGGSSDNTVTTWDAGTGQVTAVLPQPAPVTGVALSPDGGSLATSSTDGTVRVWAAHPGPLLAGPTDAVFNAVYSADGRTLAVASRDETVRFWDMSRPSPVPLGAPLRSPTGDRFSGTLAFAPDGRTIAIGTRTGRIQFWDLRRPDRPALGRTVTAGSALVQSVAFSPDGRLFAAGGDDHRLSLWDTTGRLLGSRDLGTTIVLTVAFSPDSTTLASTGTDNVARLWRVTAGGGPAPIGTLTGFAGYTYGVAFRPDGRFLAVSSADSTVRLFDVTVPAAPVPAGPPLSGPSSYAYFVAFHPDGGRLAVAATDGTVWLWDLADHAAPAPVAVLSRSANAVYAVAFSPDGRVLAGAGSDRLTRLWDIDPARVADRVCATAGHPISEDEWTRYAPGVAYQPPCR
ncbi:MULTISPECIES: nSTAND1 domain-containing NTPase [Catenuloplanes]|uniref:WD40 repeat protein/transcriptional regulator with XRE-family HTH domain n=1 Tax=Catenuloplanes niger TaxID=587534 RepID=A0AAE3ZHE3_9ACTN|nr:hypothetical protein [Catenuloplanes niger]MDR7320017.1 WD40 repeat protein/transcriptional regulator with XRE-family HTH domain [Catenuloplanes niger]